MNLDRLHYFWVLSEECNYTKAAELLHITQPSLSNAITKLEMDFGVELFKKTGRGIELTRCGEALLPYVEAIFHELSQAKKQLSMMSEQFAKQIRLGFLYTLSAEYIPEMIRRFCEQCNEPVHFQLMEGYTHTKECTPQIINALREGKIDIAFVNRIKKFDDVNFVKVAEQDYVALVNPKSPLSIRKSLDLEDTADEPFIQYTSKFATREEIRNMFREVKVDPHYQCEVDEVRTMAALVSANVGFTIVPMQKFFREYPIRVLPISNPLHRRPIYMGYLHKAQPTPLVQQFIDYVRNEPFFYESSHSTE